MIPKPKKWGNSKIRFELHFLHKGDKIVNERKVLPCKIQL